MMLRNVPGLRPRAMEGNRDGPRWIGGMREHVMAADDAIDDEARPPQRCEDLSRIRVRQSGAHAATVMTRTVGEASAGIGMPASRR